MRHIGHLLLGFLILSFTECSHGKAPTRQEPSPLATDTLGSTLQSRFTPPPGYHLRQEPETGFGHYLNGLHLRPAGTPVHLFDGTLKPYQDAHAAVIDLSVGKQDLQQCADAVMRLRAEHLFAQGLQRDISFHFTSGFRADFARWMQGDRIRVIGNDCSWVRTGKPGATHNDLLEFLTVVFTYAGTRSLQKELHHSVPLSPLHVEPITQGIATRKSGALIPVWHTPIEAGDVFVQAGSPGHAMIVVGVADDPGTGEQLFLLAQSYMPAQDIHVVKNPMDPALSPWYRLNEGRELETPEWRFRWEDRRRW